MARPGLKRGSSPIAGFCGIRGKNAEMHLAEGLSAARALFKFRLNSPTVFIDIEGRSEYEKTSRDNDYEDSKANDKFAHCVLPGKPADVSQSGHVPL
jgi:hypothetical protein